MKIKLSKINILHDGDEKLNPRGQIHDTTGLQLSLAAEGQKDPIRVRSAGKRFDLLDGECRLIAAQALAWKEIEAEVIECDDALAYMLASDVKANFPRVGKARAMQRKMLADGWPLLKVARLCGLTVPEAQCYLKLLDAPPNVQKRIESGDLSWSAWKELANKPPALQEKVADLPKPTIAATRRILAQARGQNGTGKLEALLDGAAQRDDLVAAAQTFLIRVRAEAHTLTATERARLGLVVAEMLERVHEI